MACLRCWYALAFRLTACASGTMSLAVMLVLAPLTAWAQGALDVQQLFEAGRYDEIIARAEADDAPSHVLYVGAQSAQKRGATEQALAFYGRLASRPHGDVWQAIGESGQHLLEGRMEAALQAARQAVAVTHAPAEAYYQLGLVLAKQGSSEAAADAFERALAMQPRLAYAHYYAGLMQYRAGRPDKMANHFETFLKLAPEAPERPEVVQIMRTVRGR